MQISLIIEYAFFTKLAQWKKNSREPNKTAESKIKTIEQNGTKWKETKQRFMPTVFPSV